MKDCCDGFTLMETLATISLILIVSFCIITALVSSSRANERSNNTVRTANAILETDRFIRERVDSLHVAFWQKADDSIEEFKNELLRTRIGKNIKSITTLYDSSGSSRGLTVEYTAGNRQMKTLALFPFSQVKDGGR